MVLLLLQAFPCQVLRGLLYRYCSAVLGRACCLFIRFILVDLSSNLLCFKAKNRKEAADHHNYTKEYESPLHVLGWVGSFRSTESIHDLTRQVRANYVSCVATENGKNGTDGDKDGRQDIRATPEDGRSRLGRARNFHTNLESNR